MEKLDIDDLKHIYTNTKSLWKDIKNQTIFITGGTGFFGKWLLSSFIYINQNGKLNNKAIVLTRNKKLFLDKHPQYNKPELIFIEGDISTFNFPERPIDYIIHAATEASVTLNMEQPFLMFDTIVNGTRHILELAREKKVKAILHTSSGAVYGQQPPNITHIAEDDISYPDIYDPGAAYAEGKRVAEMLSAFYYRQYNVNSKIARCFAFIGPYLPLESHFAVGNFIDNIIKGNDIVIKGDGTTYRSYLYASDLIIWLWTILIRGTVCRPYNIGSEEEITIEDIAKMLLKHSKHSININILKTPVPGALPPRYVPSTARAKNELGLNVTVDLEDAVNKTFDFNRINRHVL